MRRLVFLLAPVFYTGCSVLIDECPNQTIDETEGWTGWSPVCPEPPAFGWYLVDFPFCPDVRTDLGIKIDMRAEAIDLDIVDCVWQTNEHCLASLPPEEDAAPDPIEPACAGIMVAPNWRVSPCTGKMGFPCDLPQDPEHCGTTDPDNCPCMCGGTIQRGGVIVVTPDLGALAHELTHYRTDLPDPFSATRAQTCADGIDEMSCLGSSRMSGLSVSEPAAPIGEIVW